MNSNPPPEKKIPGLFLPCATVFIAGFCVMVLEIAASRLIARHLGVSLYTWTSVIAVILAGISSGGFLGGWVADLFAPKRSLFVLFFLAALGCAASPVLNHFLADGLLFLTFSWGLRIAVHVTLVFFSPALFLGMISPIVAKDALGRGHNAGRTLGDLYACSAAGSILGTFVTGYFLIALMGTVAVIGSVAGILAVMAIFFGMSAIRAFSGKNTALSFFFLLFLLGLFSSLGIGVSVADVLVPAANRLTDVIYQKDSPYGYIKVESLKGFPAKRSLVIDTLVHSEVFMKDPSDIHRQQYAYIRLYAALTDRFLQNKKTPSFLCLGGGGFVLPRYLKKTYPKGRVDVVEIDPAVTDTAIRYLALPKENPLHVYSLDARNYVDDLLMRKQRGEKTPVFEVIYGDTFNVFSVPYQLTTFEFNEKLRRLLSAQGIYILNLVDFVPSGRFFVSAMATLKKTFPYVYALSAERPITAGSRATCLLIASLRPLTIEDFMATSPEGVLFKDASGPGEIQRSKGMILTDDRAPVENMLQSVFAEGGKKRLCAELLNRGNDALAAQRLEEAQRYFEAAIRFNPDYAEAHNALAVVLLGQGKTNEASREFQIVARFNS